MVRVCGPSSRFSASCGEGGRDPVELDVQRGRGGDDESFGVDRSAVVEKAAAARVGSADAHAVDEDPQGVAEPLAGELGELLGGEDVIQLDPVEAGVEREVQLEGRRVEGRRAGAGRQQVRSRSADAVAGVGRVVGSDRVGREAGGQQHAGAGVEFVTGARAEDAGGPLRAR